MLYFESPLEFWDQNSMIFWKLRRSPFRWYTLILEQAIISGKIPRAISGDSPSKYFIFPPDPTSWTQPCQLWYHSLLFRVTLSQRLGFRENGITRVSRTHKPIGQIIHVRHHARLCVCGVWGVVIVIVWAHLNWKLPSKLAMCTAFFVQEFDKVSSSPPTLILHNNNNKVNSVHVCM